MADISWLGALMAQKRESGSGDVPVRMYINPDDGHLHVVWSSGLDEDIGLVRGQDGKVYVPHLDEHKVLTFTIEAEPAKLPDPIDLNPNDEWSEINEDEAQTDYVWEDM